MEELKNVMYTDSAVTGQAAGIGIGLIMAGSRDENTISELVAYAHETQHEKIIRALGIALALINFGHGELSDPLIDQLSVNTDPIIRYGAMYMIGTAYIGTGNRKAIKKLLHFAVSDTSNDTRRAAVINIGFVLFKNYKQVPKILNLLILSYNPHVRYGAAMALGIACAGTGYGEAVDLLEPMLRDDEGFVRQGALIGLAMVYQAIPEGLQPKVAKFRETLLGGIKKKKPQLTTFGSILALGILDAGGRNATITLSS